MEGTLCGDGGNAGCTSRSPCAAIPPTRCPSSSTTTTSGRCAITGGYVYRGSAIPDLAGLYLYGDFCSGQIWAASQQAGTWSSTLLPRSIFPT